MFSSLVRSPGVPRLLSSVERTVTVAVVPSDAQLDGSPEMAASWGKIPLLVTEVQPA